MSRYRVAYFGSDVAAVVMLVGVMRTFDCSWSRVAWANVALVGFFALAWCYAVIKAHREALAREGGKS